MKVKLLQETRIRHAAGEIVEVTQAEHDFLVGVGLAVDVEADADKPKRTKKK